MASWSRTTSIAKVSSLRVAGVRSSHSFAFARLRYALLRSHSPNSCKGDGSTSLTAPPMAGRWIRSCVIPHDRDAFRRKKAPSFNQPARKSLSLSHHRTPAVSGFDAGGSAAIRGKAVSVPQRCQTPPDPSAGREDRRQPVGYQRGTSNLGRASGSNSENTMEMHTTTSLRDIHGFRLAAPRQRVGWLDAVAGLFRQVCLTWERHRRQTRDAAELARMSDRQLQDIGFARGEIDFAVRGGMADHRRSYRATARDC